MEKCYSVIFILLALVVAVSSQSYPHFEHRGRVLVNNSFIVRGNPEPIGKGPNDSLHCVTDNSECCNNGQGHWYDWRGAPAHNGSNGSNTLYVTRGVVVVYLNRKTGGSTGMWRCDIPDSNGVLQSIFIYLGTKETGKLTSAVIYYTLDSEANEDPPEFTLTCQSKGGPATVVVWTRNGGQVLEDSDHMTSQIIVNTSSNTVYNNTLRVRGREPGNYGCSVTNDIFIQYFGPFKTILLASTQNITSLNASYTSPTKISLMWTFNNPGPQTTAVKYIVYYKLGEISQNISFNLNRNVRNYVFTDNSAGDISNVYLVAISQSTSLTYLPTPAFGPTTLMAESPEVMVSGEGSGVAGTPYTLICRVSLPSGVGGANISVLWVGLSLPKHVYISSAIYTYNATINSLPATDTVYTCTASYRVNSISSTTAEANLTINNPILASNTMQRSSLKSGTGFISDTTILKSSITITISRAGTENSAEKSPTGQPHQPSSGAFISITAGIVAVIILTILAIVAILCFLRYQHKGKTKYSFKDGNLAISQIPTGEDKESDEGNSTAFEMRDTTIEKEDEDIPINGATPDKKEDGEDYYQDTISLLPPSDPIPTENFPQYVRDMLYGGENKLKTEFLALEKLPQPPVTVAILPHNKPHNRFNNIYPYDDSRVQLKQSPGIDSCDYINASFVNGYDGKTNAYIAGQGPVDESVERFWRMAWEYEIPTIVMLTQCTEAGKIKCVRYWPEKIHDVLNIEGKFSITYCSSMPFAEYEFRKFKLQNLAGGESKHMTVTHLHYTAWPDHGVPDNVMSLIAFIRHVRKIHPISHRHPLLVHCSAGVGRTGTLILLDIIMQQMKRENTISVLHWLRTIRLQRMKLVQSLQQYEFIHCGLSELVACGETEVAVANLRVVLKRMKKTGEDGLNGFERQMKIIEEVSSHQPVTFNEARKEYNVSKNRFPDKLPSDGYRARLRGGPLPGSDYINASFVNGYKQKGAYIATQCPMDNTVDDFWRLINEFNCACIVLLQEHGEEGSCRFWPEEEGLSVTHGKLSVKLVSTNTLGDIITSKLEMVEGAARLNRPHIVHFLQLTSWPPQALPHPTAILSLIHQLTSTLMKCPNRRTVVMCSDGVSRTGTFLTIHCQLERLKTEGVVDFPQAVKSARLQRPGIVDNTDHYVFCHEVANKYLDNFDTYANFEFKEVI